MAPQGDHYRVRLTHTLDVSQIARTARPRPAAQRGPHRGHRARPRPGPHAVRPPRRAGAHAVPGPAVPPQRADAAHRRAPRERRRGAQPHLGGARRHRAPPVVHARALHPRGPDRPVRRPHRLRQSRHRRRASAPACSRSANSRPVALDVLGHTHSAAHRHAGRATWCITSDDQRPRSGSRPTVFTALDALRDFMFAEVYLRESARSEHEKAVEADPRPVPPTYLDHPERAAARVPSGARATCRPAWPTTSRA